MLCSTQWGIDKVRALTHRYKIHGILRPLAVRLFRDVLVSKVGPKMPANLIRQDQIEGKESWRDLIDIEIQTGKVPINLRRFMDYLGQDHLTGVLYGLVNLIVCVPSLVSYAHIVFPQAEFLQYMPAIVKIYFLSSAVMQLAMTLLSSIVFSIGQIQDVGLIFLAGMVRNIVHWGRLSSLSPAVLVTTGLWQCLSSSQAGNGSIGTLPKSRKIATSRRIPSQESGRDESRSNLGHWPRVDKK
eukprot:s1018_g8.t1